MRPAILAWLALTAAARADDGVVLQAGAIRLTGAPGSAARRRLPRGAWSRIPRGMTIKGTPMRVLLIPAALCGALALCGAASAQGAGSPVGLWRTIDDKTGKETGAVRIFESGGALYGRIERITDPARAGLSCVKCSDDRKNKPLVGLDIMRGLKRDGDGWDGGTILDPETGSIYKSSVRLDDGGQKLVVRGYLGVSLLGRSQTWIRTQ